VKIQINDHPPVPGALKVEQEWINVASDRATKPDPTWERVDKRGHWHAYTTDGTLPTLRAYQHQRRCDGSCGRNCGETWTVTRYVCRICEKRVRPGRVPDLTTAIPGMQTWSVTATGHDVPALERETHYTVRITEGDVTWFGVVIFYGDASISSETGWEITLHGLGPLGKRGPA
jgi:hypothetical protein